MATDMADLAASIGRMAKQQNPEAYGEWDDAELGAQLLIQQQGQVHALFQSSNEKDPEGNAVVRQTWQGSNEKDAQGKAVVRKDEPPPLPLSVQRILSGEPPLAASHPAAGAQEPDYGYGFRYNSRDPKGLGYLGTLKRPDRTGVMGEYSIGDEQGREIPSMVPTLTRKEVEQILALPEGASPSEAIKRKARVFAQQRRDAGLPVFARAGEQNTALYRDIPRDAPEARPQPPPMMPSHQTQQELNPPSPPSPWSKAQTIGAPGLGDHYVPPTTNEIMASDNPFRALLESVSSRVIGPGRPRSVAAADPYGIDAALEGKGSFPAMMGSIEPVERGVAPTGIAGKMLGSLAKTLKSGKTAGEYSLRDPTTARLRSLYQLGTSLPTTSNWAGSASEELVQAFGGDRDAALRWARMWGATSPNTSVPVNTRESISALIHALEHPGVPFTEELAQNLPDAKITMAGSKFGNLNAALEGRVLSPDMKAEAMAGFMAGEPRLPIDVHALHGIGSAATKFDPEISALRTFMTNAEGLPARGGLTNPEIYRRYEDALRRSLQDFDPKRSINQIFGEFWEGSRADKGLKPQGGPIDILRKKGLLEMGAMLDPDRLRAALRQSGWTAGAIAGFMATLNGTPATDGASADAGT